MVMKTDEVKQLLHKIESLESEITVLKHLLSENNIPYNTNITPQMTSQEPVISELNQGGIIIAEVITKDHARFFYSMFKGRKDVYSKRGGKANPKTGKYGYYIQCWNRWDNLLCPKQKGDRIQCANCENQRYKGLTGIDIMNHLIGEKENSSDVIGLYPMYPDGTCNFIVFDFDNHEEQIEINDDWIDEVNAMRQICSNNGVDALLERSRSGNGAHLWMFFEEPIEACIARKFGTALLTKGANSVNLKSFKSYDRMIPAQDNLSLGGLGNLIALPLQGLAVRKGNSVFIDEKWNAYPNQWAVLHEVKKLKRSFIEEKIVEWSKDGLLGILSGDLSGYDDTLSLGLEKSEPWEKKSIINKLDIDGVMQITEANMLYIDVVNIKPKMQNQIRRVAAYANSEFYKQQAMGFSTHGISRIIECGRDVDHYIGIPRGCRDTLLERLREANISFSIVDKRQKGRKIKVDCIGELYPRQKEAASEMLKYQTGILCAATAFGKTVVGAYLVAKRKVNTLILVHNKEIMRNWVEDLEKFLFIDEELPDYKTKSGRIKSRENIVGKLYGGHNSLTGIIDVAMIYSLGKKDDINELVKDYGMVIMDECHHGASITADEIMNEVNATFVYGLTATPKRDDGQEQKIFMQFGSIRYRYTAMDRVKEQGIQHFVYPRFTRLMHIDYEKIKINEAYQLIRSSDVRNKQIIADIEECISNGRTPLVLTKFKDHAAYFYDSLKGKADHIFLLHGGRSMKEQECIRLQMKDVSPNETIILVAIGQYIGEGFNFPRLDTMMLTTPISWQGNVEQYAGRLHRDYEGKKDVLIYDYVDSHIKVLERMYHKRLRTFKKIGYKLCVGVGIEKQKSNAIFDSNSYKRVYERDIFESKKEIVISSPGINEQKVNGFIDYIKRKQELGVKFFVLTLNENCYPKNRVDTTILLINRLIECGVTVKKQDELHEHYAIIDQEIVWYGSMNLLSREKNDDNVMRVESKEIAQELMELTFGR